MLQIDVGTYEGYQDTVEDREIALEALVRTIEDQELLHPKEDTPVGYTFQGVYYD